MPQILVIDDDPGLLSVCSVGLRAFGHTVLAAETRNAGKVCTRRMILESVWGPGYAHESQYLKVYAYRLRRKLRDEQGKFLQSDPSVGYRLAVLS